ncbi:hypothetical protein QP027_04790 [Corynebacterium breve]|uniref:Uncharacterized protein n=1 Tax=Corynebacterium breve TaxID=3049799 RepID=A0ABY8VIA9_9CORY|nr:hypothetical protein [Corynebacterium breve]WIM68706.1 hypothetical protein QP027_04790 [Corynebacterium breve]
MIKTTTYAILGALLPLTPALTAPPAEETTLAVVYGINDWLSCAKKPELPWCKG